MGETRYILKCPEVSAVIGWEAAMDPDGCIELFWYEILPEIIVSSDVAF